MIMAYDAEQHLSDEALLGLFARGDRLAAVALTRRITPRVLAYAARLLGGDRAEAEDVAQETMLRLWRSAADWHPGGVPVTAWVYRVAANLVIDRQRRGRRRGQVALDSVPEAADSGPGTDARLQDDARLRALDRALAALPDRQRQAVVLRHIEGLANPDIALVMDIGIEAVESLTARGKRALAAALSGQKAALGYEGDTDAG